MGSPCANNLSRRRSGKIKVHVITRLTNTTRAYSLPFLSHQDHILMKRLAALNGIRIVSNTARSLEFQKSWYLSLPLSLNYPPKPTLPSRFSTMSANLMADDDFGLSSDDESAMIALLDDQNTGIKRKASSHDIPSAKRLATDPIFQCAVSTFKVQFHFLRGYTSDASYMYVVTLLNSSLCHRNMH